jgi:hypothetical protein
LVLFRHSSTPKIQNAGKILKSASPIRFLFQR